MHDLSEHPRTIEPAQWYVAGLILSFTVGAVLYKLLLHQQLGHSAAMFLGLPAVLAVLLALAPKAKSATGGILKGITLALLVLAPLLGEGYLCILVASPLFYLVGIVVGIVVDAQRRKQNASACCVALFLIPMCFEGVNPQITFNRKQTVEVSKVISSPANLVELRMAEGLDVSTRLPLTLRIGFPKPLRSQGEGLTLGDSRTIHFAGAEGAPPGDLCMRVAERSPGYVRFTTMSDSSKISQWLHWTDSEVFWKPLDGTHTEVVWRVTFERQLDPAWYFNAWERAIVRDAARYLIEANATSIGNK